MTRIAVFISGKGTNAKNIYDYFKEDSAITFQLLVSNNAASNYYLKYKESSENHFLLKDNTNDSWNELINELKKYKIDWIVLAGFLFKIPSNIIDDYPNKILNIHPSLLPKYGGKGMFGDFVHKAVIDAVETESGITIHLVNERYDEGEILFQKKIDISGFNTLTELRVAIRELEHRYYPLEIKKAID